MAATRADIYRFIGPDGVLYDANRNPVSRQSRVSWAYLLGWRDRKAGHTRKSSHSFDPHEYVAYRQGYDDSCTD